MSFSKSNATAGIAFLSTCLVGVSTELTAALLAELGVFIILSFRLLVVEGIQHVSIIVIILSEERLK